MKVLFVSSGNYFGGPSPIVINQGESITKTGIEVSYFTIKGKGIMGYIRNIFILRDFLRKNQYDIIHAHYSWSGMVAALSGGKPLVVSLMGSDIKAKSIFRILIRIFAALLWNTIIVKSLDARISIGLKHVHIIPNGVDFEKFRPMEKNVAFEITKWDPLKKHILFAANPSRKEKNFPLAQQTFDSIKREGLELHTLVNVPNELMPYYFNSSDVVLLTSLWEGSPNVIKEAMACNIPIVATNVGDIQQLIKGTEGCYLSTFNPNDIADNMEKALSFNARTIGRKNLSSLNADIIAKRLVSIYETAIEELKN